MTALEKALGVDFAAEGDRYECRELLAALLDRWFADRDGTEVSAALGGTSVLWAVYRSFAELVGGDEVRANPMMRLVDQPGVGPHLAPGSPIRAGERTVARRARARRAHRRGAGRLARAGRPGDPRAARPRRDPVRTEGGLRRGPTRAH